MGLIPTIEALEAELQLIYTALVNVTPILDVKTRTEVVTARIRGTREALDVAIEGVSRSSQEALRLRSHLLRQARYQMRGCR